MSLLILQDKWQQPGRMLRPLHRTLTEPSSQGLLFHGVRIHDQWKNGWKYGGVLQPRWLLLHIKISTYEGCFGWFAGLEKFPKVWSKFFLQLALFSLCLFLDILLMQLSTVFLSSFKKKMGIFLILSFGELALCKWLADETFSHFILKLLDDLA